MKKQFAKKLGAYALAAGASVGATATTSEAAMLVYNNGGAGWYDSTSDWNQDMISFDYSGTVSKNTSNAYIPGGNPKDSGTFTFQEKDFYWNGSDRKDATVLKVGSDAGYVAGASNVWDVGKLGAGYVIGGTLSGRVWSNEAVTDTGGLGGWNFYFAGEWPFGGAGYVGLYSDEVDGRHYGWARINMTSYYAVELYEYAFSTLPGVGVIAGNGEVPEPMTLGLLALGAAGLLARRKRA